MTFLVSVLAASPLGLEIADGGDFSGLEVVDVTKQRGRRELPLTATKTRSARDWYNGATIRFRERAGARRSISLELRAYDDGVAFRYLMPKGGRTWSNFITQEGVMGPSTTSSTGER